MIQGRSGFRTSRRGFLKGMGTALAIPTFSRLPNLHAAFPPEFPFELVPPEVSGITWVHHNGRSPEMYLPETVGAGCGFIDYDNDGWMDIYLVNSGKCDFLDPNTPLRNALYHNNGNGTFTDVTRKSGLPTTGWASSAVWFDYDNDGKLDLLICRFVDFDKSKNKFCGNQQTGDRYYCIPRVY